MTVRKRTTGFEEFGKLLRTLPTSVEHRVLAKAARFAIEPGAKAVQSAAPVGKKRSAASKNFGRMRTKIRAKVAKWKRKFIRAAEVTTGTAFYATFYELGTKRQPPRPFVQRAFFSAEDAMVTRFGEALGKGIEEEVIKLRGRQ